MCDTSRLVSGTFLDRAEKNALDAFHPRWTFESSSAPIGFESLLSQRALVPRHDDINGSHAINVFDYCYQRWQIHVDKINKFVFWRVLRNNVPEKQRPRCSRARATRDNHTRARGVRMDTEGEKERETCYAHNMAYTYVRLRRDICQSYKPRDYQQPSMQASRRRLRDARRSLQAACPSRWETLTSI